MLRRRYSLLRSAGVRFVLAVEPRIMRYPNVSEDRRRKHSPWTSVGSVPVVARRVAERGTIEPRCGRGELRGALEHFSAESRVASAPHTGATHPSDTS